jgi:hypothetical protein
MILHVESDASYLSKSKSQSRAAGFFYLSNKPADSTCPPNATDPNPMPNGAVHILCKILVEICSSASEAEMASLFHNGKEACPLVVTLEELGHKQPPTPLETDNSVSSGIANDTVKQKRSKAMDMRFYWLRDRVRQKQFHVYWKPGKKNRGDYVSKHHPAKHHQAIRSSYLFDAASPKRNYFDCLADDDDPPQHGT